MSDAFEDWKKETTRARATASVCFDRALLARLEAAQKEADANKGMLEAGGTVAEIVEEIRSKTREFVFESIGKGPWRQLLSEHPPTDEHKQHFGVLMDHNPETFPPAAMAASCIEPGMTPEQAEWFCQEFPVGVVERVWGAVLEANVVGGDEKKVVTALPRVGGKRSQPQSD